MRRRLSVATVVETHIGQVVTADPHAGADSARAGRPPRREQAGRLDHFTGAASTIKGTTWIIMIMS